MTSESATRIALVYPSCSAPTETAATAHILATRLRWRGSGGDRVRPRWLLPCPTNATSTCWAAGGRAAGASPSTGCAPAAGWSVPSSRCRRAGSVRRLSDRSARPSGIGWPPVRRVGLLPVETRRSFAGPRAVTAAGGRRHHGSTRSGLGSHPCWAMRTRWPHAPVGARTQAAGCRPPRVGNGTPDRPEGWVTDAVIATYLPRPGAGPEPGAGSDLLRAGCTRSAGV